MKIQYIYPPLTLIYMSLTQNRENVKSKFLAERELIHSGLVPRPRPAHILLPDPSLHRILKAIHAGGGFESGTGRD